MKALWTPLRWPTAWKDPGPLDLIRGTAIDYLLIDKGAEFESVRERARQMNLQVVASDTAPQGVTLMKGEWPGIRGRNGGAGVSAGPTGELWINSNGWKIRLNRALDPNVQVWIDAAPAANLRGAYPYLLAIADAAAFGGRWIVTLDPQLAAGIAAKSAQALETWNIIAAGTKFFAAHEEWTEYAATGFAAVISDFTGPNEFFSHELLNLLARAGQQIRIFPKSSISGSSFDGLRAIVYPDAQPPDTALRKRILDFTAAGGMLIASSQWGALPGQAAAPDDEGPRFTVRSVGKGRAAIARNSQGNPADWAQDCVVLVSHRYDLVRFWNGGSTASYVACSSDGRSAIAHLIFYANRGPDAASVRIAGPFRAVRGLTTDGPLEKVETVAGQGSIEVHLPQTPPYVALELEV